MDASAKKTAFDHISESWLTFNIYRRELLRYEKLGTIKEARLFAEIEKKYSIIAKLIINSKKIKNILCINEDSEVNRNGFYIWGLLALRYKKGVGEKVEVLLT